MLIGLEKLHPFDIAKYDKIYAGLVRDKLVSKTSVVDPDAVTEDQMLLIHTAPYLKSLKYRVSTDWKS